MGSVVYEETAHLHTKEPLKIINAVCLWQLAALAQTCREVWCLESIIFTERTLFITHMLTTFFLTSFEGGKYYNFRSGS